MIIVIYTLVSNKEQALSLASTLLTQRRAACINIFPCQSVYMWNGELQNNAEYALFIKTTEELATDLMALITHHHPYETPAILKLPCSDTDPPFAQWIQDTLSYQGNVPIKPFD